MAVYAKNSDSNILVMQAADHGERHNATNLLNRARDRRIFVQRAVRSCGVVIARIRFQDLAQMLLAKCDDMVEFATDRSDQPLSK